MPFGATEADIFGAWSYTVGQPGQITYPGASSSILGSVVGVLQGITSGGSGSLVGSLLGPVVGVVQGVTSGTGTGSVLADGTYNVTATAMDIAGTTSAPSSTLNIVIDTQAPSAPVVGISPDTGASSTDGITTAQNLTISGTAQAGTLVAVMLNGSILGDTMAGTTGAWSYDNTAMTLPDGNYAITAQATDVAGNFSPLSTPFDATIETVNSPVIAGVSLATTSSGLLGLLGVGKSQQSLSIIGTAPPNDSVLVYLGGTLLGTANANGQGAWSYNYVPASSTVPSWDLQHLRHRHGRVGERKCADAGVPASSRRGLDGRYAEVRLGGHLGSGDPGQPGHGRRWKRHPRRRGRRLGRQLAVLDHTVER